MDYDFNNAALHSIMTVSKQNIILGSFFFFLCHCYRNSNSFLITSVPEHLLKELPAITVLFKLHEGTTNTQHKRESTKQGRVSYY